MQEFVSWGCFVSACEVRYVVWVHLQCFRPCVPAPKPKASRETLWVKAGAAPNALLFDATREISLHLPSQNPSR